MEFDLQIIKNNINNKNRPIILLPLIDSTNNALKQMAEQGQPEGSVIIAEKQTAGKGRRGKTFYSPDGGLYMSVLFRPTEDQSEVIGVLTAYTASITAVLLEEFTGLNIGIKWVNDLYANDYKICGILTECATDSQSGRVKYVIIGIGININADSFPDGLGAAGSIIMAGGCEISKSELAAELINRLDKIFDPGLAIPYMAEYRRRSIVLGEEICITGKNEEPMFAVDIDDLARLIVKDSNGNLHILNSGEVSIVQK